MPEILKKIHIFVASPSDVAAERAKLETVVDSLKPMADYLGLTLEVVDWRAVSPGAGRPQQVIFNQFNPTSWDIFIGILWHRFGTPPGAVDKEAKEYLSGTEEEFKTAYNLWKQHGKPRMVIYRCTRSLPFDIDPDQLKNVHAFFKLIEDVKGDYPTLYQTFDTTKSFEKLVFNNLQKLLFEYGEDAKTPITPEVEQVFAPRNSNNLPRRQAFFGRAKEMEIVMRALNPADRTWGVLVDGIGGIGKSAIAIEAAYRAQEVNSFDSFVFVTAKTNILEPSGIKELNPPARTLDEILNETARVLGQSGIAKLPGNEKRYTLIDALRSTRTLLIYDNLETLSKEEQEGIANFLRELPQKCKAITTSRRRGGEGGVWLRVEKLDWDAARGIIENQMSLDEGLSSKLNRVGETRWEELFDETSGSPLALVHTLGLMRVRAALTFDGALEMLRGNRDEDLQKYIFQEAHNELTANDKVALDALSFFVSSATFDAWMKVADFSRNTLETTINRLTALSLVDIQLGEERYALHPLTRTFVKGNSFVRTKAMAEMGVRFAKYWVDYANQNRYEDYEKEWVNIEEALFWLKENLSLMSNKNQKNRAISQFANLIDKISLFMSNSGRWNQAEQLYSWVYQIGQSMMNFRYIGDAAYRLTWISMNRGELSNAEYWVKQCMDAYYEHGSSMHQKADALRMFGLVAWQSKNYADAENYLNKSLEIWMRLDDKRRISSVLHEIGKLQFERGSYINARENLQAAFNMAKGKLGRNRRVAFAGSLGMLELKLRHLNDANNYFDQQLLLALQLGRIDSLANAKFGLARIHKARGRKKVALSMAQEAMKIYERLRHKDLIEVMEFIEKLKKEDKDRRVKNKTKRKVHSSKKE